MSHKTHDVIIADLAAAGCTIGLLSQAPAGDGSGVVEPNVIYGYARQNINFSATTRDGTKSVIKNANALIFGPASTQAWPTVTHVGLFDSDGDLRAYSPLGTPRTVPAGDAVSFGIEAIQFKFN